MSKHRPYLLTYPDGSRKRIDREERDSLIVAGCARQTAPNHYLYTGPVHTLHALADLGRLNLGRPAYDQGPNYLQGSFIVEFGEKRRFERMETPKGMALRMAKPQ